jgi:hypothetical protein
MNDNPLNIYQEDALALVPHSTRLLRNLVLLMALLAVIFGGMLAGL